MIVDTSALVALVRKEAEADRFADLIAAASMPRVPASAYLEAVMVLSQEPKGRPALDALLGSFGLTVVSIDEPVVRRAADAFERYGKGRHPAGLNFGDCLSYAAAMQLRAPLLFKGGDFGKTDVAVAG